ISDAPNHRVRKVTPNGLISTVAGNGQFGFSGDGGPATSAQLNSPRGVAADAFGNLFIADSGNLRVRTITPDGVIRTVAVNGLLGFSGDGYPARTARPSTTSVAPDAALFRSIAEAPNHRVRKVTPDGLIRTVAGNGLDSFGGDGGPATSAQLNLPGGVAVD